MTLDGIMKKARAYAEARRDLDAIKEEIEEEARQVARVRMQRLQRHTAALQKAFEDLRDSIDGARQLFKSPRTHAVDGVTFGIRKKPGKVVVADEAATVAKITKSATLDDDLALRTKITVNKAALKDLPARELARIGVSLEDDVDEVYIDTAKSDLDRLMAVLLPKDDAE